MREIELVAKRATIELNAVTNGRLPYYDGAYAVTPSANVQILNTANKSMGYNVTINAVPYTETLNSAGGYTATIL